MRFAGLVTASAPACPATPEQSGVPLGKPGTEIPRNCGPNESGR